MRRSRGFSILVLTTVMSMFFLGCAGMSKMPDPGMITPPSPISDNSGEYMCPYTQDDVVAMWVDKAVNAKASGQIGKSIGTYAGSKALEQIPLFGGLLGGMAGEAIGRKVAIEASGGWDYIKETSDLSFDSLEDMAVWLYATKSTNEHFQEVYKATCGIYPDLQEVYYSSVMSAAN